MTGRERILALIEGKPIDHLPFMPITMTFASKRIGVRYQDYATNYKVQTDGQILVAEDFIIDYVSTISDPACEAADTGAKVVFFPDQPPAIEESSALLSDMSKLDKLIIPNPYGGGRMRNRLNAIALMKKQVGYSKLIEGWIEGPCAEGADLRGINTLMTDFYDEAEFVHQLFEFVVEMELKFAEAQLAMGADIIGIGDAAASLVGPKIYNDFVWQYEKKLVDGIHALGGLVRLHICGDTRPLLEGMGGLGCEIVDLDYITPVSEGRDKMGPNQVISGNIDPVRTLKDGTPESVYEAVAECHKQAGNRFIVAAGCEVPRDTPPENLHAMLDYAKEHTP